MFLINFNQWKCACVGINNWVILLRARYKCNHCLSCWQTHCRNRRPWNRVSCSWWQQAVLHCQFNDWHCEYQLLSMVGRGGLSTFRHTRTVASWWTKRVIPFISQSLLRQVLKLFPQRVLHIVRSTSFVFKLQYPVVSLRPSCSCLRLLPHLHIFPSIFPPVACFTRQLLRKMWSM